MCDKPTTKRCNYCQQEIPVEALRCNHCKLGQNRSVCCDICGLFIPEDAKRCHSCGAYQSPEVERCGTCRSPLPPGATLCTVCDSRQGRLSSIRVSSSALSLLTSVVAVVGMLIALLSTHIGCSRTTFTYLRTAPNLEGAGHKIFLLANNDGNRASVAYKPHLEADWINAQPLNLEFENGIESVAIENKKATRVTLLFTNKNIWEVGFRSKGERYAKLNNSENGIKIAIWVREYNKKPVRRIIELDNNGKDIEKLIMALSTTKPES